MDRWEVSAMTPDVLAHVRDKIEAKYRAALNGLDAIKDFLGDEPAAQPEASDPQAAVSSSGTFRDRVLAVMNGEWLTVDEISDRSGVEPPRVRGVLYAEKVLRMLDRRKEGREMKYRLAEAS